MPAHLAPLWITSYVKHQKGVPRFPDRPYTISPKGQVLALPIDCSAGHLQQLGEYLDFALPMPQPTPWRGDAPSASGKLQAKC